MNNNNNNYNYSNSNHKVRYTNQLFNQPPDSDKPNGLARLIQYLDTQRQKAESRENHLRGGICPKHHIYLNYKHQCDMCD